jgi:hypothetical protein
MHETFRMTRKIACVTVGMPQKGREQNKYIKREKNHDKHEAGTPIITEPRLTEDHFPRINLTGREETSSDRLLPHFGNVAEQSSSSKPAVTASL